MWIGTYYLVGMHVIIVIDSSRRWVTCPKSGLNGADSFTLSFPGS